MSRLAPLRPPAPPADPRGKLSNWGLLRTFYFIAREGGITSAAKCLSISQPSVSASLQRLEEVLGHRLIERSGRRFALTARGQVLFAETEKMFLAVQRAEEKLHNASNLTGQLRLQIVTGARSALFDEALRLAHQRHPGLAFKIEVASSHNIVRNVAEQMVPFGVCLMVRPFAGLDCRLILRAEYGIFCGREHPLFGRSDVTLSDLRDEGFIGFACSEESSGPEPMIVLRDGAGLGSRVVGTSPDFTEVCRMLIAGLGIAVLPLHALRGEVKQGLLWQFPLEDARLSADLYFVSNPKAGYSPAEQAFLELIGEVARSAQDSIVAFGPAGRG